MVMKKKNIFYYVVLFVQIASACQKFDNKYPFRNMSLEQKKELFEKSPYHIDEDMVRGLNTTIAHKLATQIDGYLVYRYNEKKGSFTRVGIILTSVDLKEIFDNNRDDFMNNNYICFDYLKSIVNAHKQIKRFGAYVLGTSDYEIRYKLIRDDMVTEYMKELDE